MFFKLHKWYHIAQRITISAMFCSWYSNTKNNILLKKKLNTFLRTISVSSQKLHNYSCLKTFMGVYLVSILLTLNWHLVIGLLQGLCHNAFNDGVSFFNPFQPSVVFPTETSNLICSANQMAGFYMKYNTGLKWANIKKICEGYETFHYFWRRKYRGKITSRKVFRDF